MGRSQPIVHFNDRKKGKIIMNIYLLYKGEVIFKAENQRIDDKLINSIAGSFTNHTQTRDYEIGVVEGSGWRKLRMPDLTLSEDDRKKIIAESISAMSGSLKRQRECYED